MSAETPVLYLDADDEITSAAARIRGTAADRLAIVLPYGSRLATSRINFRLLAREANEHGKTLEIVAADPSARALASSAGLSVHASVAAFEGRDGDPGAALVIPERGTVVPIPREDDAATRVILIPKDSPDRVPVVGRPRPPLRTGVAVAGLLGIAALVAIAVFVGLVVLPSASITLAPRAEPIGPLNVQVVARPDVTAPNPTTLELPDERFELDVSVKQTFDATGIKVTEAKASGSVTFQNCDTGGAVSIPAGSRVSTEAGIRFRTQSAVTIKRASLFPFGCSTGSVSVEAEAAGTDGNVAAGTINRIPAGFDAIVLSVRNPDPTSGGLHDESKQVSQSDVDGALAALDDALAAEFDKKVAARTGIPTGITLFPETKLLGEATPSVNPTTLVGKEIDKFDLGLAAKGTVLGVDATPVRALADARLKSRVGTGFTLDPTSVAIQIGTAQVVGDTVTFPVTINATQVRNVDQAALEASVAGLDVPAARALLDDYGEVTIAVWPEWVTTVPTNLDRVTLTVTDPRPAPSPSP